LPIKAAAPFAERFNWTSCYAGAHLGGGFAQKNITDPVLLVQDTLIAPGTTVGITTVNPSPTGVVLGGQIGCDYQLASSSFVLGAEGSASGSTMRGSREVLLPFSGESSLVQANTDFLASVTARIGYAFDRFLAYGTAGFAFGDVQAGYSDHAFTTATETGWTIGAGIEGSFARNWSARVEYLLVDLANGSCTTACAIVNANGPPLIPNIAVRFTSISRHYLMGNGDSDRKPSSLMLLP